MSEILINLNFLFFLYFITYHPTQAAAKKEKGLNVQITFEAKEGHTLEHSMCFSMGDKKKEVVDDPIDFLFTENIRLYEFNETSKMLLQFLKKDPDEIMSAQWKFRTTSKKMRSTFFLNFIPTYIMANTFYQQRLEKLTIHLKKHPKADNNEVNQIATLSHINYLTDLKRLSLNFSECPLSLENTTHISDSLFTLTNLEGLSLKLNLNNINISTACPIADIFKYLTKLKSLSFCYNKDYGDTSNYNADESAEYIVKAITENLKNLRTLSLSLAGNVIKKMHISDITQLSELQHLSISMQNNILDDASMQAIIRTIGQLMDLKTLSLNFTRKNILNKTFSQNTMENFSLPLTLTSLSLNFSYNFIDPINITALMKNIQACSFLSILSLNFHTARIGNTSAQAIAELLWNLKNLKYLSLDLHNNYSKYLGISCIVEEPSHMEHLQHISFKYDNIDLKQEQIDHLKDDLHTLKKDLKKKINLHFK